MADSSGLGLAGSFLSSFSCESSFFGGHGFLDNGRSGGS